MTQDYWLIGMKVVGAIGLLIYGMQMMSEALQKMAGSQLRNILSRMTTNRFTGMLTGMGVTCAVQSSSATTVMTVSFVSAGLLTLAQAISVIMGANIGTTLTAWIMSLGYNVDLTMVVFPAFLVGIVLIYRQKYRFVGDFLFGIAFMFWSLVMLSTSGKELDLAHNEAVVAFFAGFDTGSYLTILVFLGIGTLITCVVQSSAAVMAITILLCSTGVLPIHLGIALVMGENIGTTATANLAALGANTEARRAALAHLLFNVFGVVWVMLVFYPFVDVVCKLVGYDPDGAPQPERLPIVLAMFHTCFNIANTSVLLPFVPQLERVVRRLMPGKSQQVDGDDFQLQYIQANLIQTPEIAVVQAEQETTRLSALVVDMFSSVRALVDETDDKHFEERYLQMDHDEELTDRMEIAIARFLQQVSDGHLSNLTKRRVRQLMREIGELESIGDSCRTMARVVYRQRKAGHVLTAEQQQQLHAMMTLCDEALHRMHEAVSTGKAEGVMPDTVRIEAEINAMRSKLKTDNIAAVNEHRYTYAAGIVYEDLVDEMEQLADYIINVVEAMDGD